MIYQKRGLWCVRTNRLYKFDTEAEAKAFLGENNGIKNEWSSDGSTAPARISETSETYTESRSFSRDEPSSGNAGDFSAFDGLELDSPKHSDDESSDSENREL